LRKILRPPVFRLPIGKAVPVAKIRLETVFWPTIFPSATFLYFDLSPTRRSVFDFRPNHATPLHFRERDNAKETTDMANGTVKWFNTTKGYGFIAPEDGGKDVFVHISAVERSGLTGLADDQKVTYELQEGRDGRQSAVDIQLA
jgi:CspA family cold shock protein